jgi:uncharacterized protein YkwD
LGTTYWEAMDPMTAVANRTEPLKSARSRRMAALLAVALLSVLASACMPAQERTFLDRTNSLRQSQGIRPLAEHSALTKKAEDWAQYMARTGRLEHSSLSANLNGLAWRSLGENVAYSSPTSNTLLTLHNQFVNSPGHRANLLNSRFTHMGVGVATDAKGRVWVAEVFAQL